MARASHLWKKGATAISVKALNASVYDLLPKSTEVICQSLASFTRYLIGYNQTTKEYPPEPSVEERRLLRPLTQNKIMSDRVVFATHSSSAVVQSSQEKLHQYKSLCLADLDKNGISRLTFDWKSPDKDPWNRTIAIFLVKHWRYAETQGAFKRNSIDPAHNTENICIGVVLRWMRGRAEEIRQGRRSPQKNLQKEMRRKKRTLFQYRRDSLTRLLAREKLAHTASEILPHQDCCSDTEWVPEDTRYPSVGLGWRSHQYTSILHQVDWLSFKYCSSKNGPMIASRRFDQSRTEAIRNNPDAPVCRELPENCYDPIFLSTLTAEEKASLNMKPISSLLNTLPSQIEKSLI